MKEFKYHTKDNLNKFVETTETIEYKNPYTHKNSNGTVVQRPNTIIHNPLIFKVEVNGNVGMLVHKHSSYDYVVNNVIVSERVGASIELLEEFTRHNIQPSDFTMAHKIIKNLVARQMEIS